MQKTRLPGKHIKITFEAFDDNGHCLGVREHFVSVQSLRNARIPILPLEAGHAAEVFWSDTVQMGFLD
jgi:hypothetical protein